jgi:hypothetical protein
MTPPSDFNLSQLKQQLMTLLMFKSSNSVSDKTDSSIFTMLYSFLIITVQKTFIKYNKSYYEISIE